MIVAVVAGWLARRPPEEDVSRLAVNLPEGHEFRGDYIPAFDISADGRTLAFSSRPPTRTPTTLFVRDLGEFAPRVLLDGGNTIQQAFSPDGRSIAFVEYNSTTLEKVTLDGGSATTVGETGMIIRGIDWTAPGEILYGAQNAGPWRVPAGGGEPEPVTELGPSDTAHMLPDRLPGERGIVFTVQRRLSSQIAVTRPGSQDYRVLFQGFGAAYVSSGHLVFGRDGVDGIFAVSFDPDSLEVSGPDVRIEDGVPLLFNHSQFRVSEDVPVYASGVQSVSSVVWVDRRGSFETVRTADARYHTLHLSPEGKRFVADESASANNNIWVHDLERDTRTLLVNGSQLTIPRFSPDGRQIAYSGEPGDVYVKAADGTGEPRKLLEKEHPQWALSWSPDGSVLALTETNPETGTDVWMLPLDGEPYPFVKSAANESSAAFSRDGAWLAYQSDASGRAEIYVQPFPGPGERILISSGGGKEPVWSRDGRELFYRQDTASCRWPSTPRVDSKPASPSCCSTDPFRPTWVATRATTSHPMVRGF